VEEKHTRRGRTLEQRKRDVFTLHQTRLPSHFPQYQRPRTKKRSHTHTPDRFTTITLTATALNCHSHSLHTLTATAILLLGALPGEASRN
jgi:hypothetical protein